MSQILTWSRQIEAKHALFLFDSCFSGTIFKSRDLPAHPPYISDFTAVPQYGGLIHSGHEMGDFIFIPRTLSAVSRHDSEPV